MIELEGGNVAIDFETKLCLRTWNIELSIPKVEAKGIYRMSGTIPPNLDLGFSTGDERFSAEKVYITASVKLGEKGDKK